jgi:micrococcal nuclease
VVAVQAKASDTKTSGVKATVTYVQDGDTANLNLGKSSLNCRIQGIDAPETEHKKYGKAGQPYGEESKKSLQSMILNKEVTVTVTQQADATRSGGRPTCKIELSGKNVTTEQLKNGSAWLWEKFNVDPATAQANRDATAYAKSQKIGLFANPNAIPPWVFKAQQRAALGQ